MWISELRRREIMTETVLSWDEACTLFEQQRTETKPVEFKIRNGTIRFRVKALTQAERDRIEAKAIKARGRGRGTVTPEEIAALKAETIRLGVVEGPEGFVATDEAISILPTHIRDGLADAIDRFVEIDEDTLEDFRGVG